MGPGYLFPPLNGVTEQYFVIQTGQNTLTGEHLKFSRQSEQRRPSNKAQPLILIFLSSKKGVETKLILGQTFQIFGFNFSLVFLDIFERHEVFSYTLH